MDKERNIVYKTDRAGMESFHKELTGKIKLNPLQEVKLDKVFVEGRTWMKYDEWLFMTDRNKYNMRILSLPTCTIVSGIMDGKIVQEDHIWSYDVEQIND